MPAPLVGCFGCGAVAETYHRCAPIVPANTKDIGLLAVITLDKGRFIVSGEPIEIMLTSCLNLFQSLHSRGGVAALLLVIAAGAQAITYHPRMDQATWISRSSVLECRLIQPIPYFGRAVFDHQAGKSLRFYLQSVSNPMSAGQAALVANAPRWNPELPDADLGLVVVRDGEFPVELEAAHATRLLAELFKGRSPEFTRRSWYGDEQAIRVAMSSVNFREAYSLYRQCLASLMPVSYDELERSRVHFDSDKWEIKDEYGDWLRLVARFLLADDEVDRVYIDGHTDDTHTTTYNVELSRKRAESVRDYLVQLGVSANRMTVRYHGERFPVETNSTEAGKAQNRRVTVRLERVGASIARRP